ncbi:LysE family transporter [Mesobacterium sp. TK19101]|uniref:LysE family transporter n=1 Tax=Mesobacterium hydrothermale TaxID=3111907 RepID=A0ABU6HFM9_9RHOB|nr:LysE family transporter [Mesobacterium sp. TK19101]MEC3860514.1 LysE family transporter [Mesobacterium sp. TK19101]
MKIAGAAYLMRIAWLMWRDARKSVTETQGTSHHAFRDGVLVNLSNPKSVLFAASVLVVIFPADMTLGAKAVIVLNHFLVELIFYAGFAGLMATPAARAGYMSVKHVVDRAAALILGALGLRLLFGR